MKAECICITYIPGDKTPIQGLSGKEHETKYRKKGKLIHNTGFGQGFEIEGAKVRLWLKIDKVEISYDIKWILDEHTSWERLTTKRTNQLEDALPESFNVTVFKDENGNEQRRINVEEIVEWIKSLKL